MDKRVVSQEPLIPIDTNNKNELLDIYFNSAVKLFNSIQKDNDKNSREHFTLCGSSIELVFANEQLMPYIMPALKHLSSLSTKNTSLKIFIWDDFTTNTVMSQPPWFGYAVHKKTGDIEGVYTNRGDIKGFNGSEIKTAYNWSANAISMYNPKNRVALYWTRDIRMLPAYETSAPLRTILNWWAEEHNCHFAHGAAVGTSHGGVLLAGKGGSGKSTAALASLNSGLLYVSDDYCLVTADPFPAAHSVFSSAKVDPNNIFRVAHIANMRSNIKNIEDEKAVFFLYPQFAEQITTGFPLRAILLPSITGKHDSELLPASKKDCLKALTLSTMCQFPGAGKKVVNIMLRLVETLPCYWLHFGTDLTQVPNLIYNLLEKTKNIQQ
ncbi:MAG: hypothetical protein LLF28_08320 [Nitrospiraceae bacterium]|nr:hypothetical protein [Nitrospiraceae bacterium]